jgi:hypothetical protein
MSTREAMNIIELALQAGGALYDELNPELTEWHFTPDELTKFAELLQAQASEPLVTITKKGNKLDYSIDINKFDLMADGKHLLYTSPPNTQQKLDKAREALQAIRDSTYWSVVTLRGIADNILKEIE